MFVVLIVFVKRRSCIQDDIILFCSFLSFFSVVIRVFCFVFQAIIRYRLFLKRKNETRLSKPQMLNQQNHTHTHKHTHSFLSLSNTSYDQFSTINYLSLLVFVVVVFLFLTSHSVVREYLLTYLGEDIDVKKQRENLL